MARHSSAGHPPIDRGLLSGLVGYALRRAQFAVFRDFARAMASLPVPLSPGEFGILVLIERNPALSQTALARAIGVDRSTLVPILDRLEQHGLVARRAAPRDRRRHALALGRRGSRLMAGYVAAVRRHERRIQRGLTPRETAQLLRLLDRLREGAR
ncbi:MAG: MarR family transcriptional regulator [Alphaproteobacteria bacterium]|nr:MarR family transcriptional regulator [Alphaproteobacteria bacterium]MCW5742571.1 MarR family transcriptional regulator [Alphaproteobacteria bacterium]